MAIKQTVSLKHTLIEEAYSAMVVVIAIAAFVVIFSLVSSLALVDQLKYQNRVINAKQVALDGLKQDVVANDNLSTSYQTFLNTPQNIISGSPTGTGSKDGDNAKIVLDALPSKYDFPALATSLQALLTSQGASISSINGIDQQVQQTQVATASPAPVPIPFQFSVSGNYTTIQNVITVFEHSIRPFSFQTLTLSGDQNALSLNVSAQTFYQPEKDFSVTTEIVK